MVGAGNGSVAKFCLAVYRLAEDPTESLACEARSGVRYVPAVPGGDYIFRT